MTLFQTILVAVTLTAVIGAGGYQARQASQLCARLQIIRQQQSPLLEQIHGLQQENDDASNQLAAWEAENAQLKFNQDPAELARLRDEIKQLKNAEAHKENDPAEAAASQWLNQVAQFKQYAAQHPDECTPEFQFLTDREWLIVVKADHITDFGDALQELKDQAAGRFAQMVSPALTKYAQAHNGRFPGELSQLQAYCDPGVEDILQQRYEIKPASVLSADSIRDLHIKTDWVIAGKDRVSSLTANHIAIFADGYTYFW